jgi:CHAT domain-containing protein/tetratricopeptide (TPR) repeat protein
MANRGPFRLPSCLRVSLLLSGLAVISLQVLLPAPAFGSSLEAAAATINTSSCDTEVCRLEAGKPIDRELEGGGLHAYQVGLAAGEYLRVIVEQRGIDVVVTLFSPGDAKLNEVDSPNGTQGPEPIAVVAEVSGSYRLQVRSLDREAPPGRYEVRIEEQRPAVPADRSRIGAEKLLAEAILLYAQGTAESLERALAKFQQALEWAHSMGDRVMSAQAHSSMGQLYYLLGENQKALDSFTEALAGRRALQDPRGEAEVLNNIGAVYDGLGEKRKGLAYYEQSLPFWQATSDRQSEATILANMGVAYSALGENQKALEYCSLALPLTRAVGDRVREAFVLTAMGKIWNERGEKQKALDSLTQALDIARSVGDRTVELDTVSNLGLVYSSMGASQKALALYEESLGLARALGNRAEEATALHNIGAVYDQGGELQKGIDTYEQALSLRRQVGDRHGEAFTLNNTGAIYFYSGETEKAFGYFSEALPLFRAVGDRRGEALAVTNLASVHEQRREPDQALEQFQTALSLSRAVPDPRTEAVALFGIARVERVRGNLEEARRQMESALHVVESLRAGVISQQLRAAYFASKQHFYEFTIDLLSELDRKQPGQDYAALALQTSERARARSLLELLEESQVDIRQGVDPVLLERERSLRQRLAEAGERQMRLRGGVHAEGEVTAAGKEIQAVTLEYEEIQAQIRTRSPRYAALTEPRPLTLEDIQQQVVDPDTVLLEYALGEERSYLWVVTPTSLESHELPPRARIESAARKVYEWLAPGAAGSIQTQPARQPSRARTDAGYGKAAGELSEMLLGPVASTLQGKRLLIVANGALQYVPFAALPSPTRPSEPLVARHEIVGSPSASVLALLRRELAGRRPAAKTVVVLADPVFDKADERVKAGQAAENADGGAQPVSKTRGEMDGADRGLDPTLREVGTAGEALRFPRLPFTRREAKAILSLVPADQGLAILDFKASRATAMSAELGTYRYIHFATHGLLNSQHPELSGIVLSLVDEEGKEQEGFLASSEVFNLKLPAELVVLSACRTGLGKEIKGEGLVGLARAFMYAGTPRVVASLWKVDDAATAELMKRFYQGMLGEEPLRPAAALRAAQDEMRKQRRWRAPMYWSAFVLQGEWR